MNDTDEPAADPEDRRGAVARLADAVAAAQAVARDGLADLDESAPAPVGTPGDPPPASDPDDRTPRAGVSASAASAPRNSEVPDEVTALRDRIAELPPLDPSVDEPPPEPDDAAPADDVLVADAPTDVPQPSDEESRSVPTPGVSPAGDPGAPEGPADPTDGAAPSKRARRKRSLGPVYAVMAVLILAVPALGYVGYRMASDSTAGEVLSGRTRPDAPGYTALVEPTPVALVIHVSDDGVPRGLTALSLSGPDQKGGAILTAPVNVRLTKPRLGIESIAGIIEVNRTETAAKVVGSELGLGFTDAVELTDAQLTTLVTPVAPLTLDNPEPVTLPDGDVLDAGTVELSAEQVPEYLAADDDGHTLSGALDREGLVFEAWVERIGEVGGANAIPGESDVGLGRYLSGLARGEVASGSFPIVASGEIDGEPAVAIDHDPAMLLVANAVPFPVAAIPGDRATVSLLNGTGPASAPPAVIQRLTYAGAQITSVGNADHFDHAETTVTYTDARGKVFATVMARALGVGKLVHAASGDNGVDLTVVLGRDVMDDPPPPLTVDEIRDDR